MSWAAEHVLGVAQGVREDIISDLRMNFEGECSEVGMYLAMARVAFREGYSEIGMYYEKAAFEEAEHAAKFAELLGEVVTDSTKKNLELRVAAENGATAAVSTIAGFVAPCAVSPLNPGSVSVISSSTNNGGSTAYTLPL